MVKPEPVKKLSKKDQLMLDEELAFKLQGEEEEERLTREKAQQIKEKLLSKGMKRANIFVDIDTESVEDSEVRAEVEIA
ncbi:hypothetical protein Tco_0919945 [Tanacetum coccineum]